MDLLSGLGPYTGLAAGGTGIIGAGVGALNSVLGIVAAGAEGSALTSGGGAAAGSGPVATGAIGSGAGVLAGQIEPAASVSTSLGKAGAVGALSVPPSWTTATPSAQLVAAPGITVGAEPIWTGMPPAMWNALPMAQLNGGGAAGRSQTYSDQTRPGVHSVRACSRSESKFAGDRTPSLKLWLSSTGPHEARSPDWTCIWIVPAAGCVTV